MANILIVEDELPINHLIKKNLCLVGHNCTQVFDGNAALAELEKNTFDLLLLDVMLPGKSGFELIESANGTPVIFVTAKNNLHDRLRGLHLGADDYIVKPFAILELVARVDAVLRRTKKVAHAVTFDDIEVDFDSRLVRKSGIEVQLKPKEFDLLEALIHNRNLALSRDRLLALVWSYDFDGDERTVDSHIQRLRKKLGLENRLKTVYKTGYRLEI